MILFKMFYFFMMNIFLVTTKPMQKILILLMNIILTVYLLNFLSKSSWLMMLFCLLMVSGLMILFIYMTSLKNKYNLKIKINFYLVFIMNIFLFLSLKFYFMNFFLNYINFVESFILMMFVNWNFSFLLMNLIFYILIVLIFMMEMIVNLKNSFRVK